MFKIYEISYHSHNLNLISFVHDDLHVCLVLEEKEDKDI